MVKIAEKRNFWILISGLVVILGAGLMVSRSFQQKPILNFGIDFTGGSTLTLQVSNASGKSRVSLLEQARTVLAEFALDKSAIQLTRGMEMLIKTPSLDTDQRDAVLVRLREEIPDLVLLEADVIGPTIGHELRQKSWMIVALVSLALLAYISWRFEWVFGVAALVALLHDALITISFSAFLGLEVNTAFVAAILTILGYSINDTIVVFDRIRENLKADDEASWAQVINLSISQTWIRSLNTSLTTIAVVGSLMIFGGVTIQSFCTVLLIGILAGTYSSIFIASPILTLFNRSS